MRQSNYDNIIKCIQHGAPALAGELITDLNQTVEESNKWQQEQRRIVEEAHKAEVLKAEEAKKPKAKSEKE